MPSQAGVSVKSITVADSAAQIIQFMQFRRSGSTRLAKVSYSAVEQRNPAANYHMFTLEELTKEIPGFKNYVSVDGGMPDNPRYALYQADYTVCLASRMNDKADFNCTVAGRCCESGDLLQENVDLPKPQRGEVLAVLVTGAYNYSMASNYNRIPRPAVVGIKDGEDFEIIRRETFADLVKNDL